MSGIEVTSATCSTARLPRIASTNEFKLGLGLVLLSLIFSMASPYFFTARNLRNVLLSVSVIGVMSAVSTLTIVSRNLDLSSGAVLSLCALVAAYAAGPLGWGWAILLAVGTGAVCGALNGLLLTRLGLNSIIATIGTLSIFRGITYVASQGESIPTENEALNFIGSGRLAGIPVSVLIMLLVFLACHVVAGKMRAGRIIYAIGSNPKAARLNGLSVDIHLFFVLVASGVSAAVAGVMLASQAGTAVPSAGVGYELLAITAVLLGGASLQGGSGRVSGTLLGVLIVGILNNGLTLIGVDSHFQQIGQGLLLLVAVAADRWRRQA